MASPRLRPPIVAAFSGDASARGPVEFGLAASRASGAPLVVVNVAHGAHHEALGHLERELEHSGIRDVETRVFEDRSASRGLAQATDALEPQLIVVGSSDRGALGTVFVGTTTERVIHASVCPVAITPCGYTRPENGVQVIGAAYVPSAEGRAAVAAAAALGRAGAARVQVLTVADGEDDGEHQAALADLLDGVEYELEVLTGDPATELIAASRTVDLLIMGSCAHGRRRAVMLGSVSRMVADQCACPLLILARRP